MPVPIKKRRRIRLKLLCLIAIEIGQATSQQKYDLVGIKFGQSMDKVRLKYGNQNHFEKWPKLDPF